MRVRATARMLHVGRSVPRRAQAGPGLPRPIPPPGVDAGAFYDLVEYRRRS